MIYIPMEQFNPYIISVRYFNGTVYNIGRVFSERNVYDYEIEFITEGNGFMVIDGIKYPTQGGMTFFRSPHQKNYGIMQYKSYLITFDILGNSKNNYDLFAIKKSSYQPQVELGFSIDRISRIIFKDNIEYILQSMHAEFLRDNSLKQLILKSLLYQLINKMAGHPYIGSNDNLPVTPSIQNKIKKCILFIEENYEKNLDISQISKMTDLSTSYLHKLFKLSTGVSPIQYVINLRLNKAKTLLTQTELEIKEISFECGFEDPSYFCKLFKQKNKLSPLEFRKYYMTRF